MRRNALLTASILIASTALLLPACAGGNSNNAGGTPEPEIDAGGAGEDAQPTTPDGGSVGEAGAQDGSPDAHRPRGDAPASQNPQPKVTECSRPALTPPASGTCAVTSAGTAGKIFRGTVLGPEEVLHGGEVLLDDAGTILCVSCDCSADPAYAAASAIECADGVISPGLINPHDHIGYANNAPVGHGTERYEHRHDWRKGKHGHAKLTVKGGASAAVKAFAELRFVMAGVTSMAAAGGVKGLARNIDDSVDELEALPAQIANSDTFPLSDSDGTLLTSGCAYPTGQTPTEDAVQVQGYLPHISEGIDVEARNEFLCTNGGGKNDVVQSRSGIVHAVGITAEDAAAIRKDGARVIWSPRSNVDLYGNTAPVTLLDNSGVPIALGTDWVASGSMNLLRELHCADDLNKTYFASHFTDADLWRMVTSNAALVVGAEHAIGKLERGYVADIAIFDGKTSKDFRAVLDAGVEDVVLVLRGGKVLYGDDALVSDAALGGGACEPIAPDVCGKAKKACVAQDVGGTTTLASIRTAGEAIYPLFFCKDKTPKNEPSCVPYRDSYTAGVTATDGDGDGVPDDQDVCPTVFDPVRLLDNGKQADGDGDGLGDACDPCPTDPSDACTRRVAGDLDADGVPNGTDNCPLKANPGQEDGDKDGRGDACDTCADANPGATACASTIPIVRDPSAEGHPGEGSVVAIAGAHVTQFKAGAGFYVQTADATPVAFGGVFVNAGSLAANLAVGNKVSLTGVYAEIYGVSQIVPAKITIDDAGTTLPFQPLPVAESDLADKTNGEKYEAQLVSVTGPLSITNDNPDAPGKYYEFVVDGSLRIDDQLFTRYGTAANATYPPALYTNGKTFTAIVGIAGYSFGNRKIWPRSAADLQ